jgi:hypothetical protein
MHYHFARILIIWASSLILLIVSDRAASAQGKAPAPAPATTTAGAPTAIPTGARPRPNKAQQIQAAYERARRLFRQSRYKAAIRAFEEVKDLRYHPILDYGIAKCHEARLDYTSAIYYLKKYLRNFPRHKMSKRHPTLADAKVKIGVLKKRLQNTKAPQPTGPGPVTPVTPPPAPGETLPRARTTTTNTSSPAATEAFPGPSPFGVPAPTFSGLTPNPPRRTWVRRSIILYFGLGGGAFAREDDFTLGEHLSANGGLTMGLLWRINPYVAVGPTAYIGGGVTRDRFEVKDLGDSAPYPETDGARLLYANLLLETRGILPAGRVDFWVGFGIGYTHISLDYDVSGTETEVSVPSLGLRGTVGLDIFLSEGFTLGFVLSFTGTVPTKVCVQDESCHKPGGHNQPGALWHLAMTFNWHVPTSSLPKVKPSGQR